MSYKDGIPLLASFDDDVDDEDLSFQNIRRPSKCRCSKRTIMFSVVLGLAIGLVVALIVGVAVPVIVIPNLGKGIKPIPTEPPSNTNNLLSTSMSTTVVQSMSTNKMVIVDTSSVVQPTMSLAVSSTPQPHAPSPTPTSMKHMPAMSSTSKMKSLSTNMAVSSSPHIPTSIPTTSYGISSSPPTTSPAPSSSLVTISLTTSFVASTNSVVSPTPTATPLPPFSNENCTDDSLVCPSKLDNRKYKVMTLSNGLRVLLISDPNSNVSAAAMDIPAGSFNDPPDYEGLAHFCEHMLFIGTKKYPETNQYSSFLQTHGGSDNAFTSTQNTNYFFNVEAEYFSMALDMFAHFFIDPLFSVDSVMDEMNAVNAEHQKNLHTDSWKLWQLLKNVSNPQHPFSQFSTGSLETLNKSGVHDQLLRYFNNSYSANTMQLVVYSRDGLDALSNMTNVSFTTIPNRNVTKATYNTTSFPPLYSGFIVHYYPEADTDTLTIYWQVAPSLQPRYRNAVGSFITQYLGHEGTTSAAYRLKTMNFATSLSTGVEVETDSYTLFMVQIELTENGIWNVSDVVRVLFQHVVRFRSINESEFARLWSDFKIVSQIRFDYSERSTPIKYVSSTASTMCTTTDPADFLGNPLRYKDSFSLTNSTLAQFTPNNSVIFLGTHKITFTPEVAEELNYTSGDSPPSYDGSPGGVLFPFPKLNVIESLYRTPFHKAPISDDLSKYWDVANDVNISLPAKNQYTDIDFTIISKSPSDSDSPVRLSNTDDKPASMWWLLDTDDFHEPRVNIRCQLNNTNANITAAWEAQSRLFAKFLETILQPRLYDATLVGYSYSIKSYTHGLSLSFSGPSGSMSKLISGVVTGAVLSKESLRGQGALFNIAKAALLDELENFNFTQLAFRYTYQYLQKVVMERPYWRNEEILAQLQGLNLSQVVDFGIDQLLHATGSGTTLLCLGHGNVNATTMDSFRSSLVGSRLGVGLRPHQPPYQFLGHYWQQRVSLTAPGNYSVVLPTLNPEDENSVVNVIFQVGEVCRVDGVYDDRVSCSNESVLTNLHLSLITQMLKDECFTFLRTINKLGYVATCLSGNNENIGSFQVLVQSEAFDGEYVYEKISEFLEDHVINTVLNSTATNLTQNIGDQKTVLKSVLERKEPMLDQRTTKLWNKVKAGQLTFDLLQWQVQLLDSNLVNVTSVMDFYNEYILDPATYRKMIIVVNGKDRDFQPNTDYVLHYENLPNNYPDSS